MVIKSNCWDKQTSWRICEGLGTSINCFLSNECLWNVISSDYKDQIKKPLDFEEVDMSVQEYDMNRYDYQKID